MVAGEESGGVTDYIDLPADKTKTSEPRAVPVTARLRAILDFRRIGPDGGEQPQDAYVFGNEVGERVKNGRTAWRAACRRAGISGPHVPRPAPRVRVGHAGRRGPGAQGAGLGRAQEPDDHEHLRQHDAGHLRDARKTFARRGHEDEVEIDRKLTDGAAASSRGWTAPRRFAKINVPIGGVPVSSRG